MRTLSTDQRAVLLSSDRASHVRVWLENPDGNMVNMSTLAGEDWLSSGQITVTTDPPISTAQFRFAREIGTGDGKLSLAPLIEGSALNVDNAGTYAPFVNPNRKVLVEQATLLTGVTPQGGDWELLWEGLVAPIDWGGEGDIVVNARDPLTRWNRTFIETETTYGDNGLTEHAEDVLQQILDDNFGAGEFTVAVSSATAFPILERDPTGNVTVMEAGVALRDQLGWNLHWRWNESANGFAPTLWEPERSSTTALWTFGPDDYHAIPRMGLDDDGIRNAGEVVYWDVDGVEQVVSDTRAASVAIYERRFTRIDARGTSVITSGQATTLLAALLDDLEYPTVQVEIDMPFFWPTELGDLYAFTANRHHDTEQRWAVFSYRHVFGQGDARTYISGSGKPSGGYKRWHDAEVGPVDRTGVLHVSDAAGRSVTGTTASTTLQSVPVPGGTFLPGRTLIIGADFDLTGTAGNKILRIDYGSASLLLQIIPAAITGRVTVDIELTLTPLVSGDVQGVARTKITLDTTGAVQIDDDHVGLSVLADEDLDFGAQLVNAGDTVALAVSRLEVRQ